MHAAPEKDFRNREKLGLYKVVIFTEGNYFIINPSSVVWEHCLCF